MVNSIAALIALTDDEVLNAESIRIRNEHADVASVIEPLRNDYNRCIQKLNSLC